MQANRFNGLLSFKGKKRKAIIEVLEELKQLILGTRQKSINQAFHTVFTRAIIESCFFHFARADRRKFQERILVYS